MTQASAITHTTHAPFAFPSEAPVFVVFRPWSHTDRQQVLLVLSGPFASHADAEPALQQANHPRAQIGQLFALGTFTRNAEAEDTAGATPTPCCVAVSWKSASPQKLKLASRPRQNGEDAQDWADFCADCPEGKGRTFGVLRACDPRTARFSP